MICGAPLSRTTILNVQLDRFPLASVAVHVTVLVPSPNKLPEAGALTTVGCGSHASVTVGAG